MLFAEALQPAIFLRGSRLSNNGASSISFLPVTHRWRESHYRSTATALLDSEVSRPATNNITESLRVHPDGSVTLVDGATASSSPLTTSARDIARPTEKGGYSHTTASKAKISAANKGKTPWNKGKTRSPEEKARIAAGVRAKNHERFLAKLAALNMTQAEYEAQQNAEQALVRAERAQRKTAKGGYRPTEETRQKISRILKEKHARGEVRRTPVDPSKVRRGFTHTEETRRKISESLRKRWATDDSYRKNMVEKNSKANVKEDTRRKISESLRQKWQDPTFRDSMLAKMSNRTSSGASSVRDRSHRERISESMKLKWKDEDYRRKTMESIARRKHERTKNSPTAHKRKKSAAQSMSTPVSPSAPVATQAVVASTSVVVETTQSVAPQNTVRKTKPLKGEATMTAVSPLEPRSATSASNNKNGKKKVVRKKKIGRKVMKAEAKPVSGAKPASGAKPVPTPAPKESKVNGSVSRLREERRDLYDLLYGDEDVQDDSSNRLGSLLDLGDDNLDTFDPYGLDDF
jgi:hypothetical protein